MSVIGGSPISECDWWEEPCEWVWSVGGVLVSV